MPRNRRFTKTLWNGVDLIVDGGYRTSSNNLRSWVRLAVTPLLFLRQRVSANMVAHSRLSVKNSIFGLPSTILTGVDFYDYGYVQDHRNVQGAIQSTLMIFRKNHCAYWQQTIGITSDHDFSYGGRIQAHQRYRERCIEQALGARSIFLRTPRLGAAGHQRS